MKDISKQNAEAIANIASIYNTENMTLTNLNVANKLKTTYLFEFGDKNKWLIHAPQDGRKTLHFIPNGGDWAKQMILDENGNVTINGDLTINGNLKVNKESRLANWRIKEDRIGTEGKADLHISPADSWIRVRKFDSDEYSSGIAALNLWADNSLTTLDMNLGTAIDNYDRLVGVDMRGCDIGQLDLPSSHQGAGPERDLLCLKECRKKFPNTTTATTDTCGNKCWCKNDNGTCQYVRTNCRITRTLNTPTIIRPFA